MRVNRIALSASSSVAFALAACSAPSTTAQSYGDPSNGGSAGVGGAGASGATSGTGQGATGAAGGTTGAGASGGTGASGGSAGAGGTGTGGAIGADAGPDARFDWPDTPPGAGECKAGRYVGTFECTYKDPAGTYSMPVTGPMSMTLTKSEQGEFLEVSDGVIDGSALIFVTFRATITGRLDCTRARFTGALKNGVYGFAIFPGGTFEGPFNSQYDRPNTAFVGGTWQLAVANPPGGSCDGTWTANYAGP